jgi:DNA-binding MarR family transcriptional regulator
VSTPAKSHRSHTQKILAHIEAHQRVTQRDLAGRLGIALGLINALVRRLVKEGSVEIVRVKPRGARYLLTPAGAAARARDTRIYLEETVSHYAETREIIRRRLDLLSAEWPHPCATTGADATAAVRRKRVVFYGAGEVAEIGYASLQSTDLQLVGVVDDDRSRHFFGMPVHSPSQLSSDGLEGEPFGCVIIMSLNSAAAIHSCLEARGFPSERIFCL